MNRINEKNIIDEFKNKFKVLEINYIREELLKEIKEFNKKLNIKITTTNPFLKNKLLLKKQKELYSKNKRDLKLLNKSLEGYMQIEKIAGKELPNIEFFKKEIKALEEKYKLETKDKEDIETLHSLLLEIWEKELMEEYTKWEEKVILEERKNLLKFLEEILKHIEELYNYSSNAFIFETGFFYDLSKGIISFTNIETIKKWLSILKKEGVNEIIELLGRISQKEKHIETQKVKVKKTYSYTVPDSYYNDEIVGITLDDDIGNTLPQEKLLLVDEELDVIFDAKFVEKKLMCFEKIGFQEIKEYKEEIETKKIEKEEKKGPIILCVDTSGSMSGTPETIAKAISLYITSKAIKENRKVLIINFSTSIDVLEIDSNTGMSKLIEFLEKSFYGGTDITPAFKYAIKKMNNEGFEKADLLAISDFVMPNLPDNLINEIKKLKNKGNKFYSLIIANTYNPLDEIFDEQWVYNTNKNNISILLNLSNTVSQEKKGGL